MLAYRAQTYLSVDFDKRVSVFVGWQVISSHRLQASWHSHKVSENRLTLQQMLHYSENIAVGIELFLMQANLSAVQYNWHKTSGILNTGQKIDKKKEKNML